MILLAVTALICSRLLFVFFHDPEGPNLLIVAVMALAIYLPTAAAYLFGPNRIKGWGRIGAVIGGQLLLVTVLYFFMK
ncbi:hypothetical protein [Mucilaginibacter segetis]|uniref:hypothetical protein n=1 Tax=Mucilaginibacter segetis TaxID=2793071 RepID=UPI001BE45C4F|nr:hypothetical protein [Mucilaginibacter segetis]